MKYTDLDDTAKKRVMNKYRDDAPLDYDWWDFMYEDMAETVKLLGITVARNNDKKDKSYQIYFSGFWSQGDGACFNGKYDPQEDAVEKIKEERPGDKTLLEIARELTVLSVTCRLNGRFLFGSHIETNGQYSHSGSMSIRPFSYYQEDGPTEEENDALEEIIRSVADWMYKQLEEEYEYLTSDEYLDDYLSDKEVNGDGEIV